MRRLFGPVLSPPSRPSGLPGRRHALFALTPRFLLAASALLAACSPARDGPHPAAGRWTGVLTPMNHPEMETPLAYEVAQSDEGVALSIALDGGVPVAAYAVRAGADTLSFLFDEPEGGVPLRCALARQDEGAYAGRCVDAAGKWAHFTMVRSGP